MTLSEKIKRMNQEKNESKIKKKANWLLALTVRQMIGIVLMVCFALFSYGLSNPISGKGAGGGVNLPQAVQILLGVWVFLMLIHNLSMMLNHRNAWLRWSCVATFLAMMVAVEFVKQTSTGTGGATVHSFVTDLTGYTWILGTVFASAIDAVDI